MCICVILVCKCVYTPMVYISSSVLVCICLQLCLFSPVYINPLVHLYTQKCARMQLCLSTGVHNSLCVCMQVWCVLLSSNTHVHGWICMYASMFYLWCTPIPLCMFACMSACMQVCQCPMVSPNPFVYEFMHGCIWMCMCPPVQY